MASAGNLGLSVRSIIVSGVVGAKQLSGVLGGRVRGARGAGVTLVIDLDPALKIRLKEESARNAVASRDYARKSVSRPGTGSDTRSTTDSLQQNRRGY